MAVRERCNTKRSQDVLRGVLQSHRLLTVEEDEENLSSPDGGAGGKGRRRRTPSWFVKCCHLASDSGEAADGVGGGG